MTRSLLTIKFTSYRINSLHEIAVSYMSGRSGPAVCHNSHVILFCFAMNFLPNATLIQLSRDFLCIPFIFLVFYSAIFLPTFFICSRTERAVSFWLCRWKSSKTRSIYNTIKNIFLDQKLKKDLSLIMCHLVYFTLVYFY